MAFGQRVQGNAGSDRNRGNEDGSHQESRMEQSRAADTGESG